MIVVGDGLDEGSVDESCFLWRLLQGKCTGVPTSLRVAVTTRPCEAAGKLSESGSYQGLEVVGFPEEDAANFAGKYLGEERGKALLLSLQDRPFIAGLMHAPLFCLLICDLFMEDQELPDRLMGIFKKIVLAVLRRSAKARGMKSSFKDLANVPDKLGAPLLELGKMAFDGLRKKQMYFTDAELDEAGVSQNALELGLLAKLECTDFQQSEQYAFSHLTLQEFLAAFYTSSEVLRTDTDIDDLLKLVRFEDGHLSTFWVFLSGLKGAMVEFFKPGPRSTTYAEFAAFPGLPIWKKPGQRLPLQLFRCYHESCSSVPGPPSPMITQLLKKQGIIWTNVHFSLSLTVKLGAQCCCHMQEMCASPFSSFNRAPFRSRELIFSCKASSTTHPFRRLSFVGIASSRQTRWP